LQLVHSGVLLLASSVAPKNTLAASLLVAGMTMFSGSIYLLVLDPQKFKAVGPITPLGGLCLIGGWVALAFGKRIPFPKWRMIVRIDRVVREWIYEQIYDPFDETREEYNGELAFMGISPLGTTRGRLFCVS
jgi:hypothetical protein